ncbi:MAG: patatin-like phospholipase family protein [Ruminococcus sp.]|jgi:predicted patatin/cPLA2 family phospholipase
MNRSGLVLEGGAMRGIYTAGVLDVFLEKGIHFDGVIGVSAGAIHGASYVSEQKGRSIRYYKKYCRDRRFMSFWSLLTTGSIVGDRFCYHDLPEKLDPFDYDTFDRSSTEFYACCSNLETGEAEYIRIKDMRTEIDVMKASASMPYVSKIVSWRGKKLLDGGCTDSIPVRAFQRMGFNRNVAVLTRHDGYVKLPENVKAARIFYRKYPRFARAIMKRYETYNRTVRDIKKMEEKGEVFVIRPSVPLTIPRMSHDSDEIQKVYDIGRMDAENRIEAMTRWLEK